MEKLKAERGYIPGDVSPKGQLANKLTLPTLLI